MSERHLTDDESLYFLENLVNSELNRQGVGKYNLLYNRKKMEAECMSLLYNKFEREMSETILLNSAVMRVLIRNLIESRKSVNTRRKSCFYIILWYFIALIIGSFMYVFILKTVLFEVSLILGSIVAFFLIAYSVSECKEY